MTTLVVIDQGESIASPFDDVLKYHGRGFVAGFVHVFKGDRASRFTVVPCQTSEPLRPHRRSDRSRPSAALRAGGVGVG